MFVYFFHNFYCSQIICFGQTVNTLATFHAIPSCLNLTHASGITFKAPVILMLT